MRGECRIGRCLRLRREYISTCQLVSVKAAESSVGIALRRLKWQTNSRLGGLPYEWMNDQELVSLGPDLFVTWPKCYIMSCKVLDTDGSREKYPRQKIWCHEVKCRSSEYFPNLPDPLVLLIVQKEFWRIDYNTDLKNCKNSLWSW